MVFVFFKMGPLGLRWVPGSMVPGSRVSAFPFCKVKYSFWPPLLMAGAYRKSSLSDLISMLDPLLSSKFSFLSSYFYNWLLRIIDFLPSALFDWGWFIGGRDELFVSLTSLDLDFRDLDCEPLSLDKFFELDLNFFLDFFSVLYSLSILSFSNQSLIQKFINIQ